MRETRSRSLSALQHMRVAFVSPTNPVNADSGGKQFSMDRLLGLAELAQVDVFCMSDTQEDVQRLSERLKERPVYCAGRLKPRSVMQWILSILFGLPLSVWRNRTTDFLKLIQSKHSAGYDLIYVDHWLMWPAASCFQRQTPRVLNLHKAEHLLFERAAQGRHGLFHLALRFESWRVRRYLKKIASNATIVHAISEADKVALASIGIPSNRITAILPSVDLDVPHAGRPGGRVLFVGTLSWAPNAEGLNWFLREVLPELALGIFWSDKPFSLAQTLSNFLYDGQEGFSIVPMAEAWCTFGNGAGFAFPLIAGLLFSSLQRISCRLPIIGFIVYAHALELNRGEVSYLVFQVATLYAMYAFGGRLSATFRTKGPRTLKEAPC